MSCPAGGISSLFFAFADLVIHSIFNTNTRDWTINDASSYLDLSPLYGSSQAQVDSVRRKLSRTLQRAPADCTRDVRRQGRHWQALRGRLCRPATALHAPRVVRAARPLLPQPQCKPPNPFAPRGTGLTALGTQYVAERILAINELGSYRAPSTLGAQERAAQDEELFQRARLVNSALFMQVILGDYVGAILGLTRDGLAWRLDPLAVRLCMRGRVCACADARSAPPAGDARAQSRVRAAGRGQRRRGRVQPDVPLACDELRVRHAVDREPLWRAFPGEVVE